MKLLGIHKSLNPKKKFSALFIDNGKPFEVDFGARGYEDYTIHGDYHRKLLYLLRHARNENWDDPVTPGALSRWILWNKPSLKASIADFKKRFDL